MSKRFPFTKRAIEAFEAHDPDSKNREAEYSDVECIGLKLRVSKGGRKFSNIGTDTWVGRNA